MNPVNKHMSLERDQPPAEPQGTCYTLTAALWQTKSQKAQMSHTCIPKLQKPWDNMVLSSSHYVVG